MNKHYQPSNPNPSHPQIPSFYEQNDEIDLKELFIALWQGKWIIILTTLVFAIGAITHALTAQEWWSSSAKIAVPQVQDFRKYQSQVKQYQPIFDVYQDDGTILVNDFLDRLIEPVTLFQSFVMAFDSNKNKRNFLDSNAVFQNFKSKLDADADADADADEATRRLYNEWFSKLTISQPDKNNKNIIELKVQATTKLDSYTMLQNYIDYISYIVRFDALQNLNAIINTKKNELLQQKTALSLQAKQNLEVEIQRAEYALQIATAAKVNTPVQNLGEKEIFSINLGSAAIEAKINALKTISNLSVIEPRLQQIDSKLTLINDTKINPGIEFATFQYLDDVQMPLNRDKPKRALIAVLGALLGGMLGVAIVLVKFAFRKESK
ncbi:Wzz/FepE/Etk N-terminal domain-containing protein [Vibrio aestuarianus]|uniref:Wzz/FepE/Etk N-terminal domain-containing protein n=1 Tax=Vibrio aestuarianus TaxID=28171 RepID=UPI00237C84AF|nr:Wzz/FepE/Etk N-terminal domain-containing protein [Vibrio aestuarianus]MDE1335115.1 Wzz/FepE/Etk N-terminal domain-containing protein [Vibrio aestuarianus]